MTVQVRPWFVISGWLLLPGVCGETFADTDGPSMELLEFLAGFETVDGEWLDPTELESLSLPAPEDPPEGWPSEDRPSELGKHYD